MRWHETIFFLFWSSKRNHFPGNANQSVSPSFKDYFHELSGVTRHRTAVYAAKDGESAGAEITDMTSDKILSIYTTIFTRWRE